jgi:hypothetical protein
MSIDNLAENSFFMAHRGVREGEKRVNDLVHSTWLSFKEISAGAFARHLPENVQVPLESFRRLPESATTFMN